MCVFTCACKHNTNATENLSHAANSLNDVAVIAIADALAHNSSLLSLELQGIRLTLLFLKLSNENVHLYSLYL